RRVAAAARAACDAGRGGRPLLVPAVAGEAAALRARRALRGHDRVEPAPRPGALHARGPAARGAPRQRAPGRAALPRALLLAGRARLLLPAPVPARRLAMD